MVTFVILVTLETSVTRVTTLFNGNFRDLGNAGNFDDQSNQTI